MRFNLYYLRKFLGFLISKLAAVIVLEYFNCSMFLNEMNTIIDKNCWWLCYGPLITFAIFECQFLSSIFLLYERSKAINDALILLQKYNTVDVLRKFKFIRKLHNDLCEICLNMNKNFAIQLLFIITFHFVIFVTRFYTTFSSTLKIMFKNNHIRIDYVVWNSLWTLYSMFSLFAICTLSTIIQNQVTYN